jgi:hypothetical protein
MQSTDENERIRSLPTVEETRPQTRHYVLADLVYAKFQQHFSSFGEFMKLVRKSPGCEHFSKKYYIPGSLFWEAPYQLKDAHYLCKVVFRPESSLGTLAAIMFHANHNEWVYSYVYFYCAVMAHLWAARSARTA